MPKSSKKKKEKVADFSKAKLKLGKGKKLPSNAIDTSFKARSIVLSTQSIATEKSDGVEPLTKRKLGFDDLISHLKHYNPTTRKDALTGFKELFTAHPTLVVPTLPKLIPGLSRLINDEDPTVRKTLVSLFSWLLPQIPKDILLPHAHPLLLFTTAAQTHIFPEIRIDALRFLDVLLAHIPDTVVDSWWQDNRSTPSTGKRVLEGYLAILCAGTTNAQARKDGSTDITPTANVIISPASKLVIYQSLSLFCDKAFQQTSERDQDFLDLWYMESMFLSRDLFSAFKKLLHPDSSGRARYIPFDGRSQNAVPCLGSSPWLEDIFFPKESTSLDLDSILESLDQSHRASPHPQSSLSKGTIVEGKCSALQVIARLLQPTLVAAILDSAPSISHAPSELELKTMQSVLDIAVRIYSAWVKVNQESANSPSIAHTLSDIATLLKHASVYFPFHPPFGSENYEDIYLALNLSYCQLCSLHAVVSRSTAGNSHMNQATEYLIQLLNPAPTSSAVAQGLRHSTYLSMLPTIWTAILASTEDSQSGDDMLELVVRHSIGISSKAHLKRPTVEFVAYLILLDTEYSCRNVALPLLSQPESRRRSIEGWILHLPKVLWEIGISDMALTEIILFFLLRLTQRQSPLLFSRVTSAPPWEVLKLLSPFFSISHPTRGTVLGPFARMGREDKRIRQLALNVVQVLTEECKGSNSSIIDSLTFCVQTALDRKS